MRLLAWNLNHRAARRRVPNWVSAAIQVHAPDIAILTEYVEGPDHAKFLNELRTQGLGEISMSGQIGRENQVLICSRKAHDRGALVAPLIHSSVPPNTLHIVFKDTGLHVVGFRMPAFSGPDRRLKRATWDWLLQAAATLKNEVAVIAGDFNTAVGDSPARCGDRLDLLTTSGWLHVRPVSGWSWRHKSSGSERSIDHAFLTPAITSRGADYSWQFRDLDPEAAQEKVGIPDHAILTVDFDLEA
jgi:exonuclease III